MAVLLDEGEGWDEDGVVELDEGLVFEEAVGDGVGFVLIHGEKTLVEEGFGGELGVSAEEGVEEGEVGDVASHDHDADGKRSGEYEAGPPQRSAQKIARRANEDEMPVRAEGQVRRSW